jgi:hypothetical protein
LSDIRHRLSRTDESRRWDEFLERRHRLLLGTGELKPALLRLATIIALGQHYSWAIRRSRSPAHFSAELVVTNPRSDRERFLASTEGEQALLEPTFTSTSFDLPEPDAHRLFALFAAVTVPFDIIDQSRGNDGVTYFLSREMPFASIRATWFHRGPANWSALTQAFHEAWDALDHLAASRV